MTAADGNSIPEPTGSPIDRIKCEVDATSLRIRVKYMGLPGDLVAAGAIEPEMAEAGRKGCQRADSHGDRFMRVRRASGRLWFTRSITSIERACALPGVDPESLRSDVADILWLRQNPGRLRVDDQELQTSIIGSRADLEAAGFARSFLPERYNARFPDAFECLENFYLIVVAKHQNVNRDAASAAELLVNPSRDGSRPALRLVVDNTRPAGVSVRGIVAESESPDHVDSMRSRIRQYIASVEPVDNVEAFADPIGYRNGLACIERIAGKAKGHLFPTVKLTTEEIADALHFILMSTPRNPRDWWRSDCVGFCNVIGALENSVRELPDVLS